LPGSGQRRRGPVGGAAIAEIVSPGASAVACNITVDRTNASDFLAVAPADTTSTSFSSVNWSQSGAIVANTGIVRIVGSRAGGVELHGVIGLISTRTGTHESAAETDSA